MTKERVEELKKVHGNIYKGVISYKDSEGKKVEIVFVHKEPAFEQYESFQNDIMKLGAAVSNSNLLASIIVDPAPAEIVPKFAGCPIALDQWVMKNVLHFFGGDVQETSSKKL